MSDQYKKGVVLALITALISGVSIFVNKFAVDAIHPAVLFTTVKNSLVGIAIFALLLVLRKWRNVFSVSKKDAILLVLIALVGGAIPFYLFFTGLSMTSAINAAIIQKTLVFWVALFAIPLLRERLSRLHIIGVLLLFWGNVFIGGFKGFTYSLGELYILLATVLWGVEYVIAKRVLARVDPDIVTGARMGLGSVFMWIGVLVFAPQAVMGGVALSGMQWFWLLTTVVFLLGYVMTWYRALSLAPATLVSSVLVLSTLVTNILSAVFVTHVWSITMLYQFGIMILGSVLFLYASRKQFIQVSAEVVER